MPKKRIPEHANHERWLVSYADFITLLFAFFTVLYAISSVDSKKMGKLVMAMQMAFDVQGFAGKDAKIGMATSENASSVQEQLNEGIMPPSSVASSKRISEGNKKSNSVEAQKIAIEIVKSRVEEAIKDEKLKEKVSIKKEDRGLVISLAEQGFFDSGRAYVRAQAEPVLYKIASSLMGLPNLIRIEGHTDNMPISTPQFPSNWELSTSRATFIIQYFISNFPFPPESLSAAGYGEYRPVASNDTPEGRAKNRRVDIVILSELTALREEPKPYTQNTPATPPPPPHGEGTVGPATHAAGVTAP